MRRQRTAQWIVAVPMMALALATDDRIEVQVFHDERAAAFCALGLGMVSGHPAVVLTTR